METEALSDLGGQVSLFPGGSSLGIRPSPAGLGCSGLVLTGGSWRCCLRKLEGAYGPSAPGKREVIWEVCAHLRSLLLGYQVLLGGTGSQ